jgi:hypothetical protein
MAGALFTRLLRVVGNERSSPALLNYEKDIVSEIQTAISSQKSHLQSLQDLMPTLSDTDRKLSQAKELELLRWDYVLRIYHATRFKKIQTLVGQMILPVTERLSVPEQAFSENLARAIEAALPERACEFSEDPEDLSAFVFFQAIEDLGPTLLSSSATAEAVPLERNQIYFARLEHIKHLLDSGRVFLL